MLRRRRVRRVPGSLQAAIADLLRIATAGTGVLPQGKLHPDLVARVATEAVETADRFLGMVVGAFDYLPPVDVTFGDVIARSSPPTTRCTPTMPAAYAATSSRLCVGANHAGEM